MRSRTLTCITAATLFVALVIPIGTAAQEQSAHNPGRFTVYNLGTPLGGTISAGSSINDLGWVAGNADLTGNITTHATLWLYGFPFDLGTLGGPNSNVVFPGLNDVGEVVGVSETADIDPLMENWSCSAFFPTVTNHKCVGFVWRWGSMTPLPTLGGDNGFAAGVNNSGQVVGWAENTTHDPTCVSPQVLQFRAVMWGPRHGQIQQLPAYGDDPDSAAVAINDKGQVVGISGICQNAVGQLSAEHAVLWENGHVTNLVNLGGAGWNTPTAINSQGQIVGFADLPGDENGTNPNFHAFLWTRETGKMQDLGTLPGDAISEALGINDQGQVVGVSFSAGFASSRAFLWQNGVMTDLNTLIQHTSLTLANAGDINNLGEITGSACVSSNGTCASTAPTSAFLAIPGFSSDAASTEARSMSAPAPAVGLPASLRLQLLQRLSAGHPAAGSTTPQ